MASGIIGPTGPTGMGGHVVGLTGVSWASGAYGPSGPLTISDEQGNSVAYDMGGIENPVTIEGNIRQVAVLIIKNILEQQESSRWLDKVNNVWYKRTNFTWGPYSFNFRPKELEVAIMIPTPEDGNMVVNLCEELRKLKDLNAFW